MANYYRPPGVTPCQSVALVPWSTGLLLLGQRQPVGFRYQSGGTILTPVPLPVGLAGFGFASAVSDGAAGVWATGYFADAVFIASGGIASGYALPAGDIFFADDFKGTDPYFLQSNGSLYVGPGTPTLFPATFGEQAVDLCHDASHLYAALPNSSNLGVLTLVSPVSGSISKIAVPFQKPYLLAASGSQIAVAGTSNASISVSGNAIVVSHDGTHAALLNTAGNLLSLFTGPDLNWVSTSSVTGTGSPVDISWASSGEQVLTVDTSVSTVEVYNLVTGAFVAAQALTIANATRLGVTPDGLTALILRTSANILQVLKNTANVWALAGTVTITTAPTSIVMLSSQEAAVGYQAGAAGGLQWVENNAGTWSDGIVVSGLPVLPTHLTADSAGTVYGIGTLSGSGYLFAVSKTGILAQTTWTGSANALLWNQGQIAVLDDTSNLIRCFSLTGNVLAAQGTIVSSAASLGVTGETVWLLGPSPISQYRWTAPFILAPVLSGRVSVFVNGSGFTNAVLGVEHVPSALTWDVSGAVWVATADNQLFHITVSGMAVSGSVVPPYDGQTAGAPLGISALTWFADNHLYSASSLNGLLGQIR
jgi:hypothetical protein